MVGPQLGRTGMTGGYGPHLQRRNGIFHFRMRVPEALQLRVGLVEVRKSLRTYNPSEARLLAAKCAVRVTEAFEMIKAAEFSKEDGRRLVEAVFKDLTAEVDDGFLPRSDRPDLEMLQQAALSQERLAQLEDDLSSSTCPPQSRLLAEIALQTEGLSFEQLPAARQVDLYQGITRALIEQQRVFLFRLNERLLPWRPHDALFTAVNCTASKPTQLTTGDQRLAVGPSLPAAVDEYLVYGRARWTVKTLKSRQRMLGYLVEHLGAETKLASVTPADVRGFRDAIRRLRSNHHRSQDRSFAGKQTECEAKRIAPKTALLIFEPAKAFFAWATTVEGLIERNPAEAIRIGLPKKAKAQKSRRPFQAEELKALFSSPVFGRCKSAHRRFQPGQLAVRDAYFWIPILGYYTGARLGEIVQLHVRDARLAGNVPHLAITDDGAGEPGSATAKHIKSAAGIRNVPLHPHLLDLGFGEFVEQRRKLGKSKRLFHEIAFGSDGQASTVFSKWFRRLLNSAGLKDPAVVFHSFRHNAEDAFRDALQPQYVIDRIIGHSDGTVSAQYGKGVSLEVAQAAVEAMKVEIDVRTLLRPKVAPE